jgi:hypothetical protein
MQCLLTVLLVVVSLVANSILRSRVANLKGWVVDHVLAGLLEPSELARMETKVCSHNLRLGTHSLTEHVLSTGANDQITTK